MKSIPRVGHLIRKDWLMFNKSQKHPVAEAWGSSRLPGHSPSSWPCRFCGLRMLSSWLGLRLEFRCWSAEIHVESFISKSSLLTDVSSWRQAGKG